MRATTLYQAIGGRPALIAAVDGRYGRLLADAELAPFFPGGVGEQHRRYVAAGRCRRKRDAPARPPPVPRGARLTKIRYRGKSSTIYTKNPPR
jgi:hypothetical protein